MRIFTGVWAFGAAVMSILLLSTLSYRPWGFATAACCVVLLAASLFLHRVPVWPAFAGMVFAAGAVGAGLAVSRTQVCCMFAVSERRGYPFGWLVRAADYEDLPGRLPPPSFADDAAWVVRTELLLADLVIWGVIGVAVMVCFGVVVRQARRVGLLRIRRGSFLDLGDA